MKEKDIEMLEWALGQDKDPYNKKIIQSILDKLRFLELLKERTTIILNEDKSVNENTIHYGVFIKQDKDIILLNVSQNEYKTIKEWLENDK